MFYVGRAENLVAVFGEQNPDHQANSQVTIFISTGRKGHVGNLYYWRFSNFFSLEKLDKTPREVFTPELQKVRLEGSHTISHSRLNVIKEVRD